MLDETTPADNTPEASAEGTPAAAEKPAKKAAARKTAAKKTTAKKAPAKRAAKKVAAPAADAPAAEAVLDLGVDAPVPNEATEAKPAKKAPAKRTRKTVAQKAAEAAAAEQAELEGVAGVPVEAPAEAPADEAAAKPAKKAAAKKTTAKKAPAKKTTAKKTAAKKVSAPVEAPAAEAPVEAAAEASETLPLFQTPEPAKKPARRTRKTAAQRAAEAAAAQEAAEAEAAALAAAAEDDETVADEAVEAELQAAEDAAAADETTAETADADENGEDSDEDGEDSDEDGGPTRRRRRRGGRRRRKSSGQGEGEGDSEGAEATSESSDAEGESSEGEGDSSDDDNDSADGGSSSSRRRRRRRRAGDSDGSATDDPENTVVRVREAREARRAEDQITAVSGSTRLEAKKQRRREGREAGRRRAPIVSEAEFLARREAVDRTMVIRQRPDLTQIAVLEDKVLVEHYVARESQTSLIGNVYLGRVQNVLPSMEAAFVDIGKGRNAVLYAGEVNWSSLGHKEGQPRKIEAFLSPGQQILVQVTKDPIGHKGARLTSQVSLAGRFLVYVPDGTTSGISRKLPDTERARLKALLKEIVPDSAGVIVRTAAEGASEDELTADVERLKARWEDIEAKKGRGNGPTLLYGEPDLTLKVVRDLFTEDFTKLVVEGDDAWDTVSGYVEHVAPDLAERLEKYEPKDAASAAQGDAFSVYRIDEQIAKGLDRKVWLPSGGSLIIDRTEAMTVVDVNTGKFTGSGGNLEETVTKNNLEAAEEIVRQLRLRDIGGIIVVDFIDMVLESNRDLVLRRLVECLGRDRTRHQVAEVTSLGLVQMTRKRIGTGLLEAFSTDCDACHGRGLVTHAHPVDPKSGNSDDEGRRGRRNRGKGADKPAQQKPEQEKSGQEAAAPAPAAVQESRAAEDRGAEQDAPAAAGESTEQNEPRSRRRNRGRNRGERNQNETAEASASTEDAEVSEPAPETAAAEAVVEKPVEVEPVVEEAVAEELVTEEPEAEQPAPEAEEPQEPAAPKVVTRTRTRRGASRPTTTAAVTPAPVAVEAVVPVLVAPPVPTPEESRPRVVTRTRGRAASRPAEGASAAVEGSSESAQSENTPEVEHVPVKKKGARKR